LEAGEIFCALTLFTSVKQDLDRRCEHLLATKFNEKCDFEVDDAISKLEKLEIVSKVRTPAFSQFAVVASPQDIQA
jgi:hypothetical protein